MTENFPDMCVGAGTVLNAEQVDAAVAAGAKFIVSPGLNPRTVKYCIDKNIPITPGTSSPSDIEQAIERAGTKAGNKGFECAEGAIEMVNLMREM